MLPASQGRIRGGAARKSVVPQFQCRAFEARHHDGRMGRIDLRPGLAIPRIAPIDGEVDIQGRTRGHHAGRMIRINLGPSMSTYDYEVIPLTAQA